MSIKEGIIKVQYLSSAFLDYGRTQVTVKPLGVSHDGLNLPPVILNAKRSYQSAPVPV